VSSLGFSITAILFLLKVLAVTSILVVGSFATLSWWIVFLPLIAGVVLDVLLFAVFGFTMFKVFDNWL
jgi:hypothetical protein